LGTTLTNQNSIQEKIMSRLKTGNACNHSVQNLFALSVLNCNFGCCFVWPRSLVSYIQGDTQAEDV